MTVKTWLPSPPGRRGREAGRSPFGQQGIGANARPPGFHAGDAAHAAASGAAIALVAFALITAIGATLHDLFGVPLW